MWVKVTRRIYTRPFKTKTTENEAVSEGEDLHDDPETHLTQGEGNLDAMGPEA